MQAALPGDQIRRPDTNMRQATGTCRMFSFERPLTPGRGAGTDSVRSLGSAIGRPDHAASETPGMVETVVGTEAMVFRICEAIW